MDNKTQQLLISNIDSAIEQLNSVKLLLKGTQQTTPLKKPIRKVVNDPTKENTYTIEEQVTTGWVLIDKELTNLTKEDAANTIQSLVDNESYNPSDLRVVVDGQV